MRALKLHSCDLLLPVATVSNVSLPWRLQPTIHTPLPRFRIWLCTGAGRETEPMPRVASAQPSITEVR